MVDVAHLVGEMVWWRYKRPKTMEEGWKAAQVVGMEMGAERVVLQRRQQLVRGAGVGAGAEERITVHCSIAEIYPMPILGQEEVVRMGEREEDYVGAAVGNEPGLIQVLKERWFQGRCWTWMSPRTLIYIPSFGLPPVQTNLGSTILKRIHDLNEVDSKFGMATGICFDQAVISLGVNGAGKNEACQQTIISLAGNSQSNVMELLKAQHRVLSAFGNTVTSINSDSSRFGKVVSMLIQRESGSILSASVSTMLLEKSCLIASTEVPTERRAFHVFYQIQAGIQGNKRREELFLNQNFWFAPEKLVNLTKDEGEFVDLIKAFEELHIPEEDINRIFQIVAGILNLGNSESSLAKAASLLGFNPNEFAANVAFSDPTKTQRLCDAIARQIYDGLFSWIVQLVSGALEGFTLTTEDESLDMSKVANVSVVDIPGFEMFTNAQNGFDQFLINYTNEVVIHSFEVDIFEKELALLKTEKLYLPGSMPVLGGTLSSTLIRLLHNDVTGEGLVDTINIATTIDNVDDATMLEVMRQQFLSCDLNRAKDFQTKLSNRSIFVINHYQDPVNYTIGDFQEKNGDCLPRKINEFLSSSQDPLIAGIFSAVLSMAASLASQDTPLTTNSRISQSIIQSMSAAPLETNRDPPSCPLSLCGISRQRRMLDELLGSLQQCTKIHLQCIKPSLHSEPGAFVEQFVAKQMQALRVVDLINFGRLVSGSQLLGRMPLRFVDLNKLAQLKPSGLQTWIAGDSLLFFSLQSTIVEAILQCAIKSRTASIGSIEGDLSNLEQMTSSVSFADEIRRQYQVRNVQVRVKEIEQNLFTKKVVAAPTPVAKSRPPLPPREPSLFFATNDEAVTQKAVTVKKGPTGISGKICVSVGGIWRERFATIDFPKSAFIFYEVSSPRSSEGQKLREPLFEFNLRPSASQEQDEKESMIKVTTLLDGINGRFTFEVSNKSSAESKRLLLSNESKEDRAEWISAIRWAAKGKYLPPSPKKGILNQEKEETRLLHETSSPLFAKSSEMLNPQIVEKKSALPPRIPSEKAVKRKQSIREPDKEPKSVEKATTEEITEEQLAKREAEASALLNELLETELTYMEALHALVQHFLQPLEQDLEKKRNPILSKADFDLIFGNVAAILKTNSALLTNVNKILEDQDGKGKIVPRDEVEMNRRAVIDKSSAFSLSFKEILPFFRGIYSLYTKNYTTAITTLKRCERENPRLVTFLQATSKKPECAGLDLGSFLIKPVQRLCKYPLFFKSLLKIIPSNHPAYPFILDADASVASVAQQVNVDQRGAEQAMRIVEIALAMEGMDKFHCELQILVPGRTLVKEWHCGFGRFAEAGSTAKKPKPHMIFLFNDIILVAKRTTGGKMEFRRWFDLEHVLPHLPSLEETQKGDLCLNEFLLHLVHLNMQLPPLQPNAYASSKHLSGDPSRETALSESLLQRARRRLSAGFTLASSAATTNSATLSTSAMTSSGSFTESFGNLTENVEKYTIFLEGEDEQLEALALINKATAELKNKKEDLIRKQKEGVKHDPFFNSKKVAAQKQDELTKTKTSENTSSLVMSQLRERLRLASLRDSGGSVVKAIEF